MKIYEVLKESGDNFGITEVLTDAEFKTLGLVVSNVGLTFCTFLDDIKYLHLLNDNITMIITTYEISKYITNRGICISSEPRISFFKMHNYLAHKSFYKLNNEFSTQIGKNCDISNLAHIAKRNVKIGDNVIIEEFASIKENTVINDNAFIGAGTIIGGEGFEYKRFNDTIMNVTHCGGVQIGKNVHVQYNTCIDKAVYPWDVTFINDNTKVDNLVQIAHAVKLNRNVMIAGNACIAGRVVVGENTWIGPNAVISNGVTIGDSCHIGIGSVVLSNLANNIKVFGNPARRLPR